MKKYNRRARKECQEKNFSLRALRSYFPKLLSEETKLKS